jgi:TrmH family RNA methyltransferase
VEGPNAVTEALAAGVVEELYVTASWVPPPDLDPAVAVYEVPDHVLAYLADAATPQGVAAVARTVTAELGGLDDGVLVVLDRLSDPGNVGTILRTADALGAAAVILTEGSADPFAPKTIRAAAGSTYHLPIVVGVELGAVAEAARDSGRVVLGLDAAATTGLQALRDAEGHVALVLFNEAHGMDDRSVGHLDGTVAIALHPRAESLNVAAAAAIALHAASTLPSIPSEGTS